MLRVGETVFSRKEHTNWISNQMVSPGNTHNCGIISTEQFTFRNMYAYTYTLMFAVKKKKGYELKIEQEGIYRRI